MTDIFDRASDLEEFQRSIALKRRQPEAPRGNGACIWCEEPVAPGLRFCNADCRDDYQKDQRRQHRVGRPVTDDESDV